MKSKIYVLTFMAFTVLLMSINAFINYKYDLYAVFDKDFTKPRHPYINERYAKMDYLLHDGKGRYDTFVFGSSRAWGVNPKRISDTAYNLSYSAGLPSDFVRDLKKLLDNGIKIKKIFLSLDEFHYKRLPEEVGSNINFIGYGSDIENLKYKASILLRCPEKETLRYCFGKLGTPNKIYNFTDDGTMYIKEHSEDEECNMDWRQYVADDRFNKPTFHSEKNNRIEKSIAEIKEFKEICNNNNIELVVYMTPTHITTYLSDDIDNLNNFKRRIVEVTDFWDFCIINHITINNYYWLETSHARNIVLDKVIDVVNGVDTNVCGEFFVYVNKNVIDEHLANMKNEREKYLIGKHIQYIPNEEEETSQSMQFQ